MHRNIKIALHKIDDNTNKEPLEKLALSYELDTFDTSLALLMRHAKDNTLQNTTWMIYVFKKYNQSCVHLYTRAVSQLPIVKKGVRVLIHV